MLESKKEHVVHQRTPFIELKEFTPTPIVKSVNGVQRHKRGNSKNKNDHLEQQLQGVLRTQITGLSKTSESDTVIGSVSASEGIDAGQMMARNLELQRPMEAIWRRIRANINYHSDFYINKIQGVVRAEVLVTKGGGLQALTAIEGQKDLVEWVKMALYKALGADFLKNQMSKKTLLSLFFRFVILPYPAPIQEFAFAQTQLNFNIFGYKDVETGKIKDVYNSLTSAGGNRESEWSFSKQLEPYKEGCLLRNNKAGCNLAIEMLTKIGLHQDATFIKQHLQYLSNEDTAAASK